MKLMYMQQIIKVLMAYIRLVLMESVAILTNYECLKAKVNFKCCCRPKVLGGITNSVSFRQGTNVEFEGPSFVESGNGSVSQKVRSPQT